MDQPAADAAGRRPLTGAFAFMRKGGYYLTSSLRLLPVTRFHGSMSSWETVKDRKPGTGQSRCNRPSRCDADDRPNTRGRRAQRYPLTQQVQAGQSRWDRREGTVQKTAQGETVATATVADRTGGSHDGSAAASNSVPLARVPTPATAPTQHTPIRQAPLATTTTTAAGTTTGGHRGSELRSRMATS